MNAATLRPDTEPGPEKEREHLLDRVRETAALLVLLSLTNCTHLVWYGRSDDRRHIVSVIEEGGTQHVRFDMVDGPRVRGVGVDGLVIDESGRLAYPAELSDGSWVMIRDGVSGPRFDAIGEVRASGARLAYTAEKAGKWHVVLATPSEAFDTILPGSLTFGPNGRFAFAAQQGTSVFAVIDGQRSAPMDAVGQFRFSPDGVRVGFVGRRQGAGYVVVDGVERGPYEAVAELELGPPEVFTARANGAWRVEVDGQPGEPFERIAGLNGTAYAGRRGKDEWIVDGARTLGPFSAIKSKLARDASGRLVFVAQRGDLWTVNVGEGEHAPWADVEPPAIAGSHVGFIGERDERSVVVIDGRKVGTWDWAGSLALSGDGARFAHLARRDEKTVLVVDGVERRVDVVVAGTLAFSKDGRRFGCVTGEPKTRRLFISRDDGKRVLVDMEELVAALSRGNPDALLTSPDVTLLRRWVVAELEN